jgi:hypothetical protein
MIETTENIKYISKSSRTEWLSGVILEAKDFGGKTDAVTTWNRKPTVFYFTLYRFLKRSTLPRESTILCSPV